MSGNAVNRQESGCRVLSVRLSQKEFKYLQETLKNYGVRAPSLSEGLRVLFASELYKSRRYARRIRDIQA